MECENALELGCLHEDLLTGGDLELCCTDDPHTGGLELGLGEDATHSGLVLADLSIRTEAPKEGLDLHECSSDGSQARPWAPGQNCGTWIARRNASIQQQAQVLITNVYTVLTSLPRSVAQSVISNVEPVGFQHGHNLFRRAASALLRVPSSTIRSVCNWVCKHRGQPAMRQQSGRRARIRTQTDAKPKKPDDVVLKVLVRTALANACEGSPQARFVRDLSRMQLADVDIGDKYHVEYFAAFVEHLAAYIVRSIDASDINRPLTGLGIASDLVPALDGVPVGASGLFTHNETLLVLCVGLVSSITSRMSAIMLDAESEGHDVRGPSLASCVLAMCTAHPAGLSIDVLRARAACVQGDGASTRGGTGARHGSSAVCEILWRMIHPDATIDCVEWDPFHRADISARRAIAKVPLATELFDVSAALDSLFGVGTGRVLHRSIAHELGEPGRAVHQPGGTRKIVYLSGAPGNIISNFKTFVSGLHVRRQWKSEGRGNQSKAALVDIGRRLDTTAFVTFATLCDDVLRNRVRPFALIAQSESIEPWVRRTKGLRTMLDSMIGDAATLSEMRCFVLRSVLLMPYLSSVDMKSYFAAQLCTKAALRFPTFFNHIYEILLCRTFCGCELQRLTPDDPKVMCLSPRCQCHTRRKKKAPHRTRIKIKTRDRALTLLVPDWVAHCPYNEKLRAAGMFLKSPFS